MKRLTTNEFIEKAKIVHGDKYDYSKMNYVNNKTKIIIICPIHGEYLQSPDSHLRGGGCPICGGNQKKNADSFIKESQKIHGDKYDYSMVRYVNNKTRVTIICPIHGKFTQLPYVHLNGFGCKKCGSERQSKVVRLTKDEFIDRAKKIHGNKYDYSKVEYVNSNTKVCIICPIHGEFWITPYNHLMKKGCKECGLEICRTVNKHPKEWFFKKAKEIHGERYDYSKVQFDGIKKKVQIKCNECGEIFYQTPDKHIYSKQGCPFCKKSHLEEQFMLFLKNNNIEFEYQKRFDWLGSQSLDFYLPKYNIGIECQGKQHFECCFVKDKEKSLDYLNKIIERDIKKNNLCQEHNIRLIYFIDDKNINKTNICSIYNEFNIIKKNENILLLI